MDMYFVGLVLPEELDKKVLVWKQYMFQQYKCAVGINHHLQSRWFEGMKPKA
jgi:hypothetical protein